MKSQPFSIRTEESSDQQVTVHLSGTMDESSNFSELDITPHKLVVFDFDEVYILNSIGLRNWVMFMKSIPTGTVIHFQRLRPMAIHQSNILSGFIPRSALVQSFYAPYICDECDHQEDVLYERGKDFKPATSEIPASVNHKQVACPKGHGAMDIDAIAAKYFKFLSR